MMEQPHPSVVRFVKSAYPLLEVCKNPQPTNKLDQWWICEPVYCLETIDGAGFFNLKKMPYPVLSMPSGHQIDQRVLRALYENHFSRCKDAEEVVFAKRKKLMDEAMEHTEEWARDEGWWNFRKSVDEYNMANINRVDPTYARKAHEDMTGKGWLDER